MVRAIKLILKEPNDEIRWKFSALQIALGDVERYSDDLNEISIIPYEQLLDLTDKSDDRYKAELQKLSADRRSNGKLHGDYVFQLHQLLLAVAINVWDYPSKLDKYDMDFIVDKKDIKEGKNYVILNAVVSFKFNKEKKRH